MTALIILSIINLLGLGVIGYFGYKYATTIIGGVKQLRILSLDNSKHLEDVKNEIINLIGQVDENVIAQLNSYQEENKLSQAELDERVQAAEKKLSKR